MIDFCSQNANEDPLLPYCTKDENLYKLKPKRKCLG